MDNPSIHTFFFNNSLTHMSYTTQHNLRARKHTHTKYTGSVADKLRFFLKIALIQVSWKFSVNINLFWLQILVLLIPDSIKKFIELDVSSSIPELVPRPEIF
jgi:hypothetical protein